MQKAVATYHPVRPYVDPIQANTVREADVVVRFGNQLSMSAALNAFAITFADRMPTKTN
jgi:hypothetical protein